MNITKIFIWIILSIIASSAMVIIFLWLSGYINGIENEHYQSGGINIAFILALPIIPTFLGAKLAQDWGPIMLNKKLIYFSIINVIVNTLLLIAIQIKFDFNFPISLYIAMVWLCTFIIFQEENKNRLKPNKYEERNNLP